MGEKILFVDDDSSVLDGYQRLLRGEFALTTVLGGHHALADIKANGPYAVVISDMRMPEMDGIEFLSLVRRNAPESVRILLTGHADFDTAIEAVNRGNIFRFLTKPCKRMVLIEAIESGLAQYRTASYQKELLVKAKVIEKATSGWYTTRPGDADRRARATNLAGPVQAEAHLAGQLGVDPQCHVVMMKLTTLDAVEERYGEKVADDYFRGAIQLISRSLTAEDRLFKWNNDVLMAVIRRNKSFSAIQLEISRLFIDAPQHFVEQDGSRLMIAFGIKFDVLPATQFSTLSEMLTAFDARANKTF